MFINYLVEQKKRKKCALASHNFFEKCSQLSKGVNTIYSSLYQAPCLVNIKCCCTLQEKFRKAVVVKEGVAESRTFMNHPFSIIFFKMS